MEALAQIAPKRKAETLGWSPLSPARPRALTLSPPKAVTSSIQHTVGSGSGFCPPNRHSSAHQMPLTLFVTGHMGVIRPWKNH